MRRVIVALVTATAGLTLIGLFQNIGNRHSIEDDLTSRSGQALSTAGISADVAFRGRDGIVTVHSAADKDRAREIVRRLAGVRVARVEVPVVPATPPTSRAVPQLRIEVDGAEVTGSGSVPTEAVKAALGAGDQLVVDPRLADSGVGSLPAVVSALGKDAGSIVIELHGDRLTLTGTVASQEVKDATKAAAQRVASDVVDQLRVRQSPQQTQAKLSSLPRVTFANNSATLTAQGRQVVANVAEILTANPAVKVSIQGHTDSKGSAASNLALSDARARAVLTRLVSLGIASDRLTATGFGSSRPKVPNTGETSRAVNRRVEFIVR
jgi:outer membrane protein OmpA-like peptidoglycan-associated protein